jgi:hypothetical protein
VVAGTIRERDALLERVSSLETKCLEALTTKESLQRK